MSTRPTLPSAKSSSWCDGALPGLPRGVERAVLLDEPAGELLGEPGLLGRLHRLGGPEEQAVLVLDLDDGDGRVLGQGDAGVRVGSSIEGGGPGLVASLEGLVEEEQAPEVALAARSPRCPSWSRPWPVRPVGGDGDVDALLLGLGDEPPDAVDLLLIDVGDLGVRPARADLGVEPDHVHAHPGEEPDVPPTSSGSSSGEDLRADRPEPGGRSVAEDEAVAVGREPDEARLAGLRLVQRAEVDQALRVSARDRSTRTPSHPRRGGSACVISTAPAQGRGAPRAAGRRGRRCGYGGRIAKRLREFSSGGPSGSSFRERVAMRIADHQRRIRPIWNDIRHRPSPSEPLEIGDRRNPGIRTFDFRTLGPWWSS